MPPLWPLLLPLQQGQQLQHNAGAARLAASKIVNAAPTHISAMAVSQATLVVMKAPSEHENAPFDTASPLNVAVATTTGPAATHVTATLAVYSGIANMAQTEAVSKTMLVTMRAVSGTENAPFDTVPLLHVATSSASFPPSTYCLMRKTFVIWSCREE